MRFWNTPDPKPLVYHHAYTRGASHDESHDLVETLEPEDGQKSDVSYPKIGSLELRRTNFGCDSLPDLPECSKGGWESLRPIRKLHLQVTRRLEGGKIEDSRWPRGPLYPPVIFVVSGNLAETGSYTARGSM